MAQKSAGGRFYATVTGGYDRVSGSLAAYLNKRFDPRTTPIEVICCLLLAGGVVGIATQVTDPPNADLFRLLPGMPAPAGTGIAMGAALAAYLGLLFLVELPTGARTAGALLSAVVAGGTVQTLLLAKLSPRVAAVGLILAPALVISARCRLGLAHSVGLSGIATLLLAILRDFLRS